MLYQFKISAEFMASCYEGRHGLSTCETGSLAASQLSLNYQKRR